MREIRQQATPFGWAIWMLAAIFFCLLLYQTFSRITFPWDILIWSESPFMTNMLKLTQEQPLFDKPWRVNSFVYAPGLEYLTYAVLAPFGVQLDVRFCRLIVVFLGLGAALMLSLAAVRIYAQQQNDSVGLGYRLFAFLIFVLLLFRNFTADVVHPDNLHAFHFAAVFLLALQALQNRSLKWALLAVVVAGLGVWAKQVAALSVIGVLAAFWSARCWTRPQLVLIGVVGFSVLCASLGAILIPELERYYLLDLLSQHPLQLQKVVRFFEDLVLQPHRWLLLLGALYMLRELLRQPAARPYLILWLALGIFEVLPAGLGYIKEMGLWNNLIVVDLWLLVVVFPLLVSGLSVPVSNGAKWYRKYAPTGFALLMVLSLVPVKTIPGPEYWRYAGETQDLVSAALANDERVLVAHGTMFQIKAGDKSVPLDRANSFLELRTGDQVARAGTEDRLRRHYYDRIFYNSIWYGNDMNAVVDETYRTIEVVRRVPETYSRRAGWYFGLSQALTLNTPVMIPRKRYRIRRLESEGN